MDPDSKKIIRVLVVEDSPSMRKLIASILNSSPHIQVVAVACNGQEAVDLVPRIKPDIITMDIHMPLMDGFESTKQIMAYNPTPILIVSASVFAADMNKVFKSLSYGALDVVDKNVLQVDGGTRGADTLIEKVKFLSKIRVLHHPLCKFEEKKSGGVVCLPEPARAVGTGRIVSIVASTGGPQALLAVLNKFPRDFPCGIVIVQHITTGFDAGLADWLSGVCRVRVKLAENSEVIRPAVAYIAPCDLQMKVVDGARIMLCDEPACCGHKPSADVLLESVARVYGKGAVAAILTGMGRDGANGIKAVKDVSGATIAEDESTCVVFGMPKAAIDMGAVDKVMPLPRIADEIVRALG